MCPDFTHQPVMLDEVVQLFAPVPAGLVVDATVGGAGHASGLLRAHSHLQVLGLDQDPDAVEAATAALASFGDRAAVRHARFDDVAREVHDVLGADAGASGVLFDLGVSSVQFDRPERGFSYRFDAPLDMRMDPTRGRTAAQLLADMTEGELTSLLAANGEGRFARRIARALVAARPVTTGQLADTVRNAIPAAARRTGGHPARRVFQALRIAVNDELQVLADALDGAIEVLAPGGRCVAIAYHSGEDRLVKTAFSRAASGGCSCPPGLPCVCGAVPLGRLVFRGARRPTPAEVASNRRAESARLRAFERIEAEAA